MRVALLAAALLLTGCPDLMEAPPSATCARVGDKCKLGNGPLGVCVTQACPEGQTEPCYLCQPQH